MTAAERTEKQRQRSAARKEAGASLRSEAGGAEPGGGAGETAVRYFAALNKYDPNRGFGIKTYHLRGYNFVAGNPPIEVPDFIADRLDTIDNVRPLGADRGPKAFTITER